MTFLEAAKTVEIPSYPGAEDLIPCIQRLILKVFFGGVLTLLLPSKLDLPLAVFALIAIDGKTFKWDALEASKTVKSFQHTLFWVVSPEREQLRLLSWFRVCCNPRLGLQLYQDNNFYPPETRAMFCVCVLRGRW